MQRRRIQWRAVYVGRKDAQPTAIRAAKVECFGLGQQQWPSERRCRACDCQGTQNAKPLPLHVAKRSWVGRRDRAYEIVNFARRPRPIDAPVFRSPAAEIATAREVLHTERRNIF